MPLYRIAQKFCEDFGISHDNLNYYINHREDCLKMVSNIRKKAKTKFLKTLYLGNVKLYCDNYNEVDGELTTEGKQFIARLSNEVNTLATRLWKEYPQLHKLKTGKEKKSIDKKPNPQASLMSILFQTEERKMLMVWDSFLTHNGRYLGVYIHDGGLVERLAGETKFPEEMLVEGGKQIQKYTGYNVALTQQNIEFDWTPEYPDKDQYARMKMEFEQHTFLVGSNVYHI